MSRDRSKPRRSNIDDTSAKLPDLFDRAFQRRISEALAAIALPREEAGDAPVWKRRIGRKIGTHIVDAGKFLR